MYKYFVRSLYKNVVSGSYTNEIQVKFWDYFRAKLIYNENWQPGIGFRFRYLFDYSPKVRHIMITVSASERNERKRRRVLKLSRRKRRNRHCSRKKETVKNLLSNRLTYFYDSCRSVMLHPVYWRLEEKKSYESTLCNANQTVTLETSSWHNPLNFKSAEVLKYTFLESQCTCSLKIYYVS